jgi:hypothetical protein
MRQNDAIGQDDRIFVTIDRFNNRRSGYYFGVNPNGVRTGLLKPLLRGQRCAEPPLCQSRRRVATLIGRLAPRRRRV